MNDRELLLAWGQFDDPQALSLPTDIISSLYGEDITPGGPRFATAFSEFVLKVDLEKAMNSYARTEKWEKFTSFLSFDKSLGFSEVVPKSRCKFSSAIFDRYWQPKIQYGPGLRTRTPGDLARLCWAGSTGSIAALNSLIEACSILGRTAEAEQFELLAADESKFFSSGIIRA